MAERCNWPGCAASEDVEDVMCPEVSAHPYGRRIAPGAVCLTLTDGRIRCIAHLDEHLRIGDVQRFGIRTAGVRRYMIGPRCLEHAPAAVGRPEVQPDPERTLAGLRARNAQAHAESVTVVLNTIPGTTVIEREQPAATGRCEACGGTCSLHVVFPGPPWLDEPGCVYGQPPAQTSRLGLPASVCGDCSDPLSDPGLLTRCRDRHALCNECGAPFDQLKGEGCQRRRHPKAEQLSQSGGA